MKHRLHYHLLAGALTLTSVCAYAQSGLSVPEASEQLVFPQKKKPAGIDNYLFNVFFNSGKNTFNLRGLPVSKGSKPVTEISVNPSGTSVAVVETDKKGKTKLTVYHLYKSNSKIKELKEYKNVSSISYTPDARQLAIATPGKISFVDARTFQKQREIIPSAAEAPSKMTFSSDGKNLAVLTGNEITVYDNESGTPRKSFDFDTKVCDIDFSNGGDVIAILTDDGVLHSYDTDNFFTLGSVDGLGLASALSFNPDDKYVSVVTGDNRIAIINRLDESDRDFVEDELGGISDARFVRDLKGNTYLVYNTNGNITYRLMSLAPNLNKLLSDELEDKMSEWMKMLPGETLDEYNLRVNEETRLAQIKLLEQEIATNLAEQYLGLSEISLGNYNPESGILALNFDNLPSIYLNVPGNELNDFLSGGDLELRNAKYGLTDDDKFELIYADVYNKKSGKSYSFDNLNRESLAFLQEKENFVPLELMQQTSLEEIALQEVKQNIVNTAMEAGAISDHTHFNVESRVIMDKNYEGDKITNYQINFSYEVEPGFSATEDFGPGKYVSAGSPAANAMLKVIKTAFENDFAQYVKPGKKLNVKITGMADALPIKGKIAYKGEYGNFYEEPVLQNGNLTAITVNSKTGITDNQQLAFLRAVGVEDYIKKNISNIDNMDVDYSIEIELSNDEGGEFRRIKAEFTFIDAFEN